MEVKYFDKYWVARPDYHSLSSVYRYPPDMLFFISAGKEPDHNHFKIGQTWHLAITNWPPALV